MQKFFMKYPDRTRIVSMSTHYDHTVHLDLGHNKSIDVSGKSLEEIFVILDTRSIKWYKINFRSVYRKLTWSLEYDRKHLSQRIFDRFHAWSIGDEFLFENTYKKG